MPNCTVSMEVQDLDFAVTEKGDRNCSRFTAAAECFYSTVFGLFRPPFSKPLLLFGVTGSWSLGFPADFRLSQAQLEVGEGQSLLNTPRLLPPAGQAGSQQEELGHCVFISADA